MGAEKGERAVEKLRSLKERTHCKALRFIAPISKLKPCSTFN